MKHVMHRLDTEAQATVLMSKTRAALLDTRLHVTMGNLLTNFTEVTELLEVLKLLVPEPGDPVFIFRISYGWTPEEIRDIAKLLRHVSETHFERGGFYQEVVDVNERGGEEFRQAGMDTELIRQRWLALLFED